MGIVQSDLRNLFCTGSIWFKAELIKALHDTIVLNVI
jgi:hypothetical protein